MKISFIGSGNVAWHLSQSLEKAGNQICEVYSRDIAHAEKLCYLLYSAKAKNSLDFSESEAELFILAVSDDAIQDVCTKIILPENAIIAHTSGSKSLDDLQRLMQIHHDLPVFSAVFYPLMTFSKGKKLNINEVPFCIEASSEAIEQVLVDLAQEISETVYLVTSNERKVLHLGAVFACNFTNHLLALSKEILAEEELDFDLLKPLLNETIRKALSAEHPADVQTGPAVRNDETTIIRHLDYLHDKEDLKNIYNVMTDSIQKWHE